MKLSHSIACLFLLIGTIFGTVTLAQNNSVRMQLKQKIRNFEQKPGYVSDTAYMNALIDLATLYSSGYPDSALLILAGNAERCKVSGYKNGEVITYSITGDALLLKGMYKKALENFETSYELAKNIGDKGMLATILNRMGTVYLNQGNYTEALNKFYESLKTAESIHDNELIGATLNNIGTAQFYQGRFTEAEITYMQRLKIVQNMHDTSRISDAYNNLGEVNLQQKNPVKALRNLTISYKLALQINDQQRLLNTTLSIAETYYELDSLPKSVSLFEKGLQLSKQTDHGSLICSALIGLAKARYKQGLVKEALANGLEGLQRAEQMGQVQLMRDANEIVSTIYEAMNDGNKALKYYRAYKLYSDSMNNLASQRAVAEEKASYEFSKKEIVFQRQALQQQWLTFSAFAGLMVLAVILWLIMRNRNRLKHTYSELQYKNKVIETQKSKAEETLFQLQATQAQLIQSEKMASLGELTAGIAHEIQNPLNFVTNFSEVNNELISELVDEVENKNYDEVKALAADIKTNEEKINHHGKRADAIVKGMLQHSRKSEGKKEPTNINALCDEFLRLSYQGLRTKDQSFNADFTTNFDETIGNINIVPQDMGRVLLNLFNNAFYTVNEKKKTNPPSLKGSEYKPLVTVTTKKINPANNKAAKNSPLGVGGIQIVVQDNGSGIPSTLIDKIFQPFFTTKPTGQGTGLGLSLAYDIITKEHQGTITAESKAGEGSAFTIQLPLK